MPGSVGPALYVPVCCICVSIYLTNLYWVSSVGSTVHMQTGAIFSLRTLKLVTEITLKNIRILLPARVAM